MTPTTRAGRALFTDVDPMDMWESNGVTPEDIAKVEAEARQQERERLALLVPCAHMIPASECRVVGCSPEDRMGDAR